MENYCLFTMILFIRASSFDLKGKNTGLIVTGVELQLPNPGHVI